MKNKKHLGFTNTMFLSIAILSLLVTIFACALMWHTSDTSGLAYLIPSVFGELATITGFAVKKSEKENTKGGIVYDAALNDLLDDEPKG
jgi:hypothetical protein